VDLAPIVLGIIGFLLGCVFAIQAKASILNKMTVNATASFLKGEKSDPHSLLNQ